MSFHDLFAADDLRAFQTIDPPFNVNTKKLASYPQEVTGAYILHGVLTRLGWASFADKTVLDFGCGVRFARTIHNLNMPFGRYIGVDVNADAIGWLQENVRDPRFIFKHLNAANAMYNKGGASDAYALERMQLPVSDLATLLSVITHQTPAEADLTFKQLHRVVRPNGYLYFSAFLNESLEAYAERTPEQPGLHSTYHPAYLIKIVEAAGWRVCSIHPQKDTLTQPVFVCVRQ